MAAILKVWRHIGNSTPTIDTKFHPDPISNYRATGLLKRSPDKKKNNTKNKINSDMRSVPDPKLFGVINSDSVTKLMR